MDKRYITGWLETRAGRIPTVSAELTRSDRWGSAKATWSIGRMRYTVDPGLYAIGSAGPDSNVFVSANYKLSFDTLRRALKGLDGWILVLDTKGINVWCAAGKGTFGTKEIIDRVASVRLGDVVGHRRLIVPQLGASGVAAHEVKRGSGFSVVYGPVRAPDIQPFLEAGMVATPEMRLVRFGIRDRLRLVPVELANGLKYLIPVAIVFLLLAGFAGSRYSGNRVLHAGLRSVVNLLLAFLGGVLLGPALLPWLPDRRFSIKGLLVGLAMFVVALVTGLAGKDPVEIVGWALLMPAIASFLTMNFTGSSTYTSLSGVKKEMRMAVPVQLILGVAGLAAWLASRFIPKGS